MTAVIDGMLLQIPYLEPTPIAVDAASGGRVRMRQPFARNIHNIVGTVHAGALFTLGETAAGVAAFGVVSGAKPMVLLRRATVEYTRRAESDLTATTEIADGDPDTIAERFSAEGRADVAIGVTITDAAEAVVFTGTYEYALRRGPA